MFPHHSSLSPEVSPQVRGQPDLRGEEPLCPGSIRGIRLQTSTLLSQKTCGGPLESITKMGGTISTNRHLLPGEHQGGRNLSGQHHGQVFPITIASCAESTTPPMEEPGLQLIANQALEDWLTTKVSGDKCRQRAIGDLGLLLCQNELQATVAINEANTAYSCAALRAKTAYCWIALEAKGNCDLIIRKAKATRDLALHAAAADCSKAIKVANTQNIDQAILIHKDHSQLMQGLEEELMQEESRVQSSFLTACQVAFYGSPPELKNALTASYHLLLGQTPPPPPPILPQQTSLVGEQPASTASPHQCSSLPLDPRDDTHHQIQWRMCLKVKPLQRLQENPHHKR